MPYKREFEHQVRDRLWSQIKVLIPLIRFEFPFAGYALDLIENAEPNIRCFKDSIRLDFESDDMIRNDDIKQSPEDRQIAVALRSAFQLQCLPHFGSYGFGIVISEDGVDALLSADREFLFEVWEYMVRL